MPPLYPCAVTIVQDGLPLAEATIELHSTTEMKYRPVMITDENGKAEMKTYGFPGIPAGVYNVVVIKEIKDNVVYRDNPSTGEKELVSFKRYRAVEPEFSSAESSPHKLEITGKEKMSEFTFDVGKAVKMEVRSTGM